MAKKERNMNKEKYKNVSLSKDTYAVLIKISKLLLPDGTKLSISKTVEAIANVKLKKLNGPVKLFGARSVYERLSD